MNMHPTRRVAPALARPQSSPVLQSLLLLTALLSTGLSGNAAPLPLPKKPAELFVTTNVWNIHLKLTAENWKTMEPKGGGGGMFAGPPGPEGFGPAMFLAPPFVENGDANKDGKLSREEFRVLGEKWFGEWDKQKSGSLTESQLRDGMGITFVPPFMRGGPGGPGGAPGGGPPRMQGGLNLLGAEGKRNGLASAMGIEFTYVHAEVEFEGKAFKDVGVRYKGNGTFQESRATKKHSIKIDLNKYSKDQELAGVTTLNLHNNITDASWMNEVLSHRLFRDAGVPAPRTAYARVYVTVPGVHDHHYLGLYSLVENVDKEFTHRALGSRKGVLLKPVTREPFTDLGDTWDKYNQIYDPKSDLTAEQKARIIGFSKFMSHASDAELAAKFGDYVDIEEFARFTAINVWLSNLDSILTIGQNYYVYLNPKSDKFQFIPWDLDHSFGQFFMTEEQREQLSIQRPWQGEITLFRRAFAVEAFKKAYLARLAEFNKELCQPARFDHQVDELGAVLRAAVAEESESKVQRFDQVVSGKLPTAAEPGQGGPGMRFGMPPAKPIKPFVKVRHQSVAEQLAGKSEGKTLEGGFGFGGPPPGGGGGRPGGPGGPGPGGPGGRGGPGGPGGFGPGMFLAPAFLGQMDTDKDQKISKAEFAAGFSKWFEAWDTDHAGTITDTQLRKGINEQLSPFRGGPGGPGGGFPGGRPQ